MFLSNGMSLKDAYAEFILDREIGKSPETVKSYRYNLGKRFLPWASANGITRLKSVDRRVVRRFMSDLAKTDLADTTRATCGKCLKAFMNFSYAEGWISEPVDFRGQIPKARKKEPDVPTQKQVIKFVEAADVRDKAAIILMGDSGLRRKEICGLLWDHLDFERGRIRVVAGKGKEGVAYFGDISAWALLDWAELTGRKPGTFVFISTRNISKLLPLKPVGLSAVFRRLSEEVGFKITPHDLRRFFATEAHKNGADAFDLQKMMRHVNIEDTLKYTALVDDTIRKAHREASPMDAIYEIGKDDSIQVS